VASVPPAARLVEVIADRGESAADRYRYGSGCIVSGRTVLTAAHVVAGAQRVQVRDPDKKPYSATVDPRFVGDANEPGPDLALVEIEDPAVDLAPMGLARVDRDAPTDEPVRCRAIGYPWFAETPSPAAVRDTVDAIGVVPVLSKLAAGLLSVQVSISPRPLPPEDKSLAESEWSGMSGAPVVAAGRLLGVVVEHAPREGPSAITAVPLTVLEQDPAHPGWGPGVKDPSAWWARLGVTGLPDLQRLPVPPPERPEPAYWETVREFGRTLHQRMPQLLGREQDLAEIAAFATGSPGYRWLVGGVYAGKTALLYEAVTAGLPDEVDVVCYFLSRRASDADSSRFLAAVVPQLAFLCGLDPPVADRDQFYALWGRAAERAAGTGRPLLLVVDGLDEDIRPSGLPSVASLLPTLVEGRAHVLVASRPHPELPVDVPDGHPLTSPSIRVDLKPFEGAERLADRARQEIYSLTHGVDADTAVDVLGLLTAAAGPLSEEDLAFLSNDLAPPSAAHSRRVRRLVTEQAARSLELVGSTEQPRYQFAHFSLLEYAQANKELSHSEYRNRIHRWSQWWHDRGWPTSPDATESTPRYLLDSYLGTLASEPDRLVALVIDAGWVDAALQSMGVDRVVADLRRAAAADPAEPAVGAMFATVSGQAHHLRHLSLVTQPGYVLRQLCLQAGELGEDRLASDLRARLRSQPEPGLIPIWTTRRASRALSVELGHHDDWVRALAVLPDGRVVSGGHDRRVLVWDPFQPGTDPVELGRHDSSVTAVAVLPDGRVVSGGRDGVRVWDPSRPGTGPVELGRQDGSVNAAAVLPDGRVVSGGSFGRVLMWDPARLGSGPVELGRGDAWVRAVAGLPDGRVITGGDDGPVLVWDPSRPGTGPVELGRHDDWVRAVAVLPDGRVVSGGHDRRVLVWDPSQPGTGPVKAAGHHVGEMQAVAVLRDARVVSGGEDGRVLVWDPAQPGTDPIELGSHAGKVQVVAVLPDGRVVSGGGDGRVLVWDPARPGSGPTELGRHDDSVQALAGLPDGRVVSGGADRRVLVWDPNRPGSNPVELGRHDSWVLAVAGLPDGRLVSGGDGRVLVWDPNRPGSGPVELGRHGDLVNATLGVSLDGRVVSGGADQRVLVWDPDRPGTGPVELGRHDGSVITVAVLSDGRVVSGGADRRVLIWNATIQRQISQLDCSVIGLAAGQASRGEASLVVVHEGQGFSLWSVA
jgi:WD40 repeat protein